MHHHFIDGKLTVCTKYTGALMSKWIN